MILSRAQELSPSFAITLCSSFSLNPSLNPNFSFPNMRSSTLFLLRSLSLTLRHHNHRNSCRLFLSLSTLPLPCVVAAAARDYPFRPRIRSPLARTGAAFVEHLAHGAGVSAGEEEAVVEEEKWDFSNYSGESGAFVFEEESGARVARNETKHLESPELEVKELEDLPEQWRRAKLAWLCKELPAHKAGTLLRILNAQRKWMRQEDATYVAVHFMRIRENEAGFRVYKWMMQQSWYRFDFALATKLADYMGKEGKFAKCRQIFDDIIDQGRIPSESTFHILIVAYLSTQVKGCLEEACSIYNRMIQLAGYQPRLSLHNSLFRALVSKPAAASKQCLKQAEFIFHNLVTSDLEIHRDFYGGLIWLHSYQETIDKERIANLSEEMRLAGIQESKEVLVSILRACSKEGDVAEAERTWLKLLRCDGGIPSQAFVYKMEVYAKIGEFMRSLEAFKEMKEQLGSPSVAAYHKIIEIFCKAQQIELAESLMKEFLESGKKPLMPSYIDLVDMYLSLGLHNKLELTFVECMEKCRPNRTIYNIYLDSLVRVGNLGKAEEIFNEMQSNGTVGVSTRSCNTILRGYLASGDYVKAEKIYDIMCQNKYDIESPLMEQLDRVLSLVRKDVKKPVSLKLSKEQREILVGLLLGGLQIVSDEERKNHMIRFDFRENYGVHSILRQYINNQYHEWLHPSSKPSNDSDETPFKFSTISHSYFGFYADQFFPRGVPVIPKLIHRWLSPRVLAYWYMYGGHRTSSGDILLRLRGSLEGVEKVVKTLKAKSLDCRVKKKGKVFWIGLMGSNSTWFWKLTEPYILEDLKDFLKAGGTGEIQDINFDSGSDLDLDQKTSDYSEDDDTL